jgi:hypothetical protein
VVVSVTRSQIGDAVAEHLHAEDEEQHEHDRGVVLAIQSLTDVRACSALRPISR